MADFSHFDALAVKAETTTDYQLTQISINGMSPTLKLRPATEANSAYFNAALRSSSRRLRAVQAGGVNADMLEEQRRLDKDLFPRHVMVGWKDMTDANGDDVPFTGEAAKDFVHALPDWIFDAVREHAGAPANFVDVVDIETTAKNLPSG